MPVLGRRAHLWGRLRDLLRAPRGDDGRGAPRRRVRGRALRLRPTGVGARRGGRLSKLGDAAPVDITALDRRPDDAAAVTSAVRAADAGAEPSAERDPDAAAIVNPDVRAVSCADGAAGAGADAGAYIGPDACADAIAGVVCADCRALAQAVVRALLRPDDGGADAQGADAAPESCANDFRSHVCEPDGRSIAAAFGRSFGPAIVKSDPGAVAAAVHTAVADAVYAATYVARAVIDADVATYDPTVAAAHSAAVADPNALRGADGRADIEAFYSAAHHEHAYDARCVCDGHRHVSICRRAQRKFRRWAWNVWSQPRRRLQLSRFGYGERRRAARRGCERR